VPRFNNPAPRITGTLPRAWANLTNLAELRLANNSLQGTLPWYGDAAFVQPLRVFDVTANTLSGMLIPSVWQAEELLLGFNRLSGGLSVVSGTSSLVRLSAAYNTFTGPMPDLSAASSLLEVDLRGNMLTGPVPDALGPNITRLLLEGNYLSGTLPGQVGGPPAWVVRLNAAALCWTANAPAASLISSSSCSAAISSLPHAPQWSNLTNLTSVSVTGTFGGALPAEWSAWRSIRELKIEAFTSLTCEHLPSTPLKMGRGGGMQ
jgi:hypothetical protein